MKRKITMALMMMSILTFGYFYSEADFFICVLDPCNGSANADVMIGEITAQVIDGLEGSDVIFGGPAANGLAGGPGNDLLFGGPESDVLLGEMGNDVLLGGPDSLNQTQNLAGFEGNDTYITFAGETVNCLTIFDNSAGGHNVVNLIGYGPYSASYPFGQPNFGSGSIIVQDPIAGGYVIIHVEDPDASGTIHTINGLLSPNVTIVDDLASTTFVASNCLPVTAAPA
jgi:hypothetical protein